MPGYQPRRPRNLKGKRLSEAAELFLAGLEMLGASQSTVKAYRSAIQSFIRHVGDKLVDDVTQEDYEDWVYKLQVNGPDRPRSRDKEARRNTAHYYSLFVRRFLEWIGVEGELAVVPRRRRRLPEALTWDEVEALLEASRDLLDAVIVAILAETGLRASELLSLTWRDVNLRDGDVRVRGKYGKERIVFLGPASRKLLEVLYDETRPRPRDRVIPITYQALYKRLKSLALRAGLDPARVRPHVLRHTFATEAVRRGISLPVLQKLLGHSNLKITEVYLHVTPEDARREYYSLFAGHPGSRPPLESGRVY